MNNTNDEKICIIPKYSLESMKYQLLINIGELLYKKGALLKKESRLLYLKAIFSPKKIRADKFTESKVVSKKVKNNFAKAKEVFTNAIIINDTEAKPFNYNLKIWWKGTHKNTKNAFGFNLRKSLSINAIKIFSNLKQNKVIKGITNSSIWSKSAFNKLGWTGLLVGTILCAIPAVGPSIGVTVIVGAGVVGFVQANNMGKKSHFIIEQDFRNLNFDQLMLRKTFINDHLQHIKEQSSKLPLNNFLRNNLELLEDSIICIDDLMDKFENNINSEHDNDSLNNEKDIISKKLLESESNILKISDIIKDYCIELVTACNKTSSRLELQYSKLQNDLGMYKKNGLNIVDDYTQQLLNDLDSNMKILKKYSTLIECSLDNEFNFISILKHDIDDAKDALNEAVNMVQENFNTKIKFLEYQHHFKDKPSDTLTVSDKMKKMFKGKDNNNMSI